MGKYFIHKMSKRIENKDLISVIEKKVVKKVF